MRVILELPEETLKKLGEMAQKEKRSRKNFMELILSSYAERNFMTQIKAQNPLTPDECVNPKEKKETVKNEQKNPSDSVLGEDVVKKIEELQKAANSCQDTKLGRLAKAGYLKQIEQLQNKNK